MRTEPNDPIKPNTIVLNGSHNTVHVPTNASGLTKREYFIGLAMQGLIANPHLVDNMSRHMQEWVALRATELADIQIEALNKEQQ